MRVCHQCRQLHYSYTVADLLEDGTCTFLNGSTVGNLGEVARGYPPLHPQHDVVPASPFIPRCVESARQIHSAAALSRLSCEHLIRANLLSQLRTERNLTVLLRQDGSGNWRCDTSGNSHELPARPKALQGTGGSTGRA